MIETGFIGAGNMGAALIRGLVRSGRPAASIVVYDVDESRIERLRSEGIQTASTAADTITPDTTMVVLAVKPQTIVKVLETIKDRIGDRPVVVSIAAGISTGLLLSGLNASARVIRVMPNAAAMVGRSASALCKGGAADDDDMAAALEMFRSVGVAVSVEEKMMNTVTALSGSGPGYLFAIMEAMTDGAVRMGLDRATARELTVQTFLGAAAMAAEGKSFSELKDGITSPGGTTIAGLQVLERAGVRGAMMDVIQAATERGDELLSG